ncbi:MAG: tRNA (adenosine(37)-N6)-dimethylallyltransferase MiaA [Cyclobacteriaceae bacterium]|nr:MAG: tRNA (adenosine(37)-N6)-dimethylallyltransferase MiaA [Cyclobacteriaceae bacterium]
MNLENKRLIVIVGPTAVGKTALAIELAQALGTEIISADSRQFYSEMTIGTAKPTGDELAVVRHHFIDSHSILQKYDAAQFGEDALMKVYELFEKHDSVIVCGGSGLYVKALLEGFDDIPEVPEEIREMVTEKYKAGGLPWLQQQVQKHDPEYYNVADQQNPARLSRALEVVLATGSSITSFQKRQKRVLPFKVIKIGLELEREELYRRIDERMDAMIEAGLFEEAEKLYPYREHNALQTVGYREIFDFMEGKYDREEAIRLLKRNSRRYAKRQLTWFKREGEIRWFSRTTVEDIFAYLRVLGNAI